jgi:AcrR family transcriptional regulator
LKWLSYLALWSGGDSGNTMVKAVATRRGEMPARDRNRSAKPAAEKKSGLRERNRDRRRREILMAAAQVFRKSGFENARIDEVAELASVAQGTVYNYFPTKETLLLELVAFYRQESSEARNKIVLNPLSDPLESIYRYYAELLDRSLKYLDKKIWRHVQAASVLGAWGQFGSELMKTERQMIDEQVQMLRKIKANGGLPAALDETNFAELVHAISFFLWQLFLTNDAMSVEEAKLTMRKRLIFLFREMNLARDRAAKGRKN